MDFPKLFDKMEQQLLREQPVSDERLGNIRRFRRAYAAHPIQFAVIFWVTMLTPVFVLLVILFWLFGSVF